MAIRLNAVKGTTPLLPISQVVYKESAASPKVVDKSEDLDVGGLPLEIWANIFSYIAAKDLTNCMQVKRTWYHLIQTFPDTAKILFKKILGCDPTPFKGPVAEQLRDNRFNISGHFCIRKARSSILLNELMTFFDCFMIKDHLFLIATVDTKWIEWDITKKDPEAVLRSYNISGSFMFTQLQNSEMFVGLTLNGEVMQINTLKPQLNKELFRIKDCEVGCMHVKGEQIAIFYDSGNCEIRVLNSGEIVNEFHFVNPVKVVHLDGTRLIIGTAHGLVQIWDLATNRCLRQQMVFNTPISHIAVQGNILAVCCNQKLIKVMPIHSLNCLNYIKTDDVKSISFNGTYLRVIACELFTKLHVTDYDFSVSAAEFFASVKKHKEILDRFSSLSPEDKMAILTLYRQELQLPIDSVVRFESPGSIKALLDACKRYYNRAPSSDRASDNST